MAIQLTNHLRNTSTLNLKTTSSHPNPCLSNTRRTRTIRVYAVSSSTSSNNARQLIQSGAVRPVRSSEAGALIGEEGFVLLDIRPVWEREKAHVTGSLHVPLFVEDKDNGPLTLLKKWVHFGYIGLWTGQYFTTLNPDFFETVEETVPDKSTKLLVACGEGLRSMMAVSKLYEGGYKNLGWLAGGFNRAKDGDFRAVEGSEKLEYATIGGVSYIFLQLLIFLRALGNNTS
ncbi:Rhodanese-like domain containing protein [Parasponia andersonii]|uniref:Rhodanese-like domain containing protein n=1 Tax=Parasponia andersonii TaxID=3476 RepID=A0A2P5BQW7_PARAD|nr:Rhodanese-like domain containing protein [Parasponia andersonii]